MLNTHSICQSLGVIVRTIVQTIAPGMDARKDAFSTALEEASMYQAREKDKEANITETELKQVTFLGEFLFCSWSGVGSLPEHRLKGFWALNFKCNKKKKRH